ncbi:glycoside hydrolase family 13 protein [Mangrovactinospora gilvigrisea]|uniref:glycoside hydrolase family 13 protein n=1 Tax=Mangrovactinospora gilvigrisea TaxID=1428644 RepID=UPI000A94E2DC
MTIESPWWRDAVIYQVYPRSFADSDGDGTGDLPGIRARLPHLAELGVDAVWLSPFYASPQADAGYDVADYRAVDPVFGTLDDAAALIGDAHELGLRVITDLVPNHCSDRHAWFLEALEAEPGSAARARFHFRDGRGPGGDLPPNDWESVFGGPAWTRTTGPDGRPGQWYLHLFAPEQPDFDWDCEDVREEFRAVLRFWLDLGVDGFRVDVAHGLVKAPGLPDVGVAARDQVKLLGVRPTPYFDQDGVHAVYREWRKILEEYGPDRIAVAEAWAPSQQRVARYVRPDELHQAFNFSYLTTPWDADALRAAVDDSLAATGEVGAPATWVLSNHDVVRHRTRLGGGLDRARAATLLMLALPGSAYLYQGEELGLPEVVDLPDGVRQDPAFGRSGSAGAGSGQEGLRDGCRVPLPWSGTTASYGFGPGAASWLPQPAEWAKLSVAAQDGDPGSTLELYRAALRLRRGLPQLGEGALEWVDGAPEGVLMARRTAAGAVGPAVLVAANTGGAAALLDVPDGAELLLSGGGEPVRGSDGGTLLPADCCAWWAV